MLAFDEVLGPCCDVVVDYLHPLSGQRTRILAHLLAHSPSTRILRRLVLVARPTIQDAAWTVSFPELWILGVVWLLGLLLRVQVIKAAIELVETVHGGQVLVAVTQVVLAEMGCGITLLLEQCCYGRVLWADTLLGARHADLAQSRAERGLARDEG
ncbi:hypothetical protein ES703_125311 [subsurface metagenome]